MTKKPSASESFYSDALSAEDGRPISELKVDLHVYIVPPELWRDHLQSAVNQVISDTVSAGFIRVMPDATVQSLREEIETQIGFDLVPREFFFLKCVGRCFTRIKPKQERLLKVKNFIPPQAYAPELFILEMTPDTRAVPSSGSTSVQSQISRQNGNYSVDGKIPGRVPPIRSNAVAIRKRDAYFPEHPMNSFEDSERYEQMSSDAQGHSSPSESLEATDPNSKVTQTPFVGNSDWDEHKRAFKNHPAGGRLLEEDCSEAEGYDPTLSATPPHSPEVNSARAKSIQGPQAEEMRKLEERMRKQKEEEKRRAKEAEQVEKEQLKQETLERRRQEEEQKRKLEEQKKKLEEQKRKLEEQKRLQEEEEEEEAEQKKQREEQKRLADEERRRKVEEKRVQEEKRKKEEERLQEEKRKKEEELEKRKTEEAVKKKKEEEERRKREEEELREELNRKQKEEQGQKEEAQKRQEQQRKREEDKQKKKMLEQQKADEKADLMKEIEELKAARLAKEQKYEELEKRAKQMQTKKPVTNKHNGRDNWKKKYFEEKKKTAPLDEHCNRLKRHLEAIQRRVVTNLESGVPPPVNVGPDKLEKANNNNGLHVRARQLEHDTEEIQQRLEGIKMKLTGEMKLRNQAEKDTRGLRAELAQRKLQRSPPDGYRQTRRMRPLPTFRS